MGYFGKDLVKAMLEKAGYTVCHYGYEDTLLDYMSKHSSKTSNSRIGRRLRKSPDLFVYDKDNVFLAEIKMRTSVPPRFDYELGILREFWSDAILVVIVPEGNVFYAQEISKLEPAYSYPLTCFRNIQEIFTRITEDKLSYYRRIALQTLQMFMTEKTKRTIEQHQGFLTKPHPVSFTVILFVGRASTTLLVSAFLQMTGLPCSPSRHRSASPRTASCLAPGLPAG